MELKSLEFRKGQESYEEYVERINVETCGLGLFKIEDEAYHKSHGMSRSALVHMIRSAQYYKYKKEEITEPTKAMIFGSAVHRSFLEPEIFKNEYAAAPVVDKRTTKGKETWAYFEAENKGKKIISIDDCNTINDIVKALHSHEIVSKMFKNANQSNIEISAYANLEEVLCRGRCDFMLPHLGMIVDLKTTQDARPYEFQRSVVDYKYHVQAAYYLDLFTAATGIKFDKFCFVCVEKEAPHGVQVYVADPEMVEVGRYEYMKALHLYKECLAKDSWPSYPEKVLNLSLPTWALNKE